jgi:hypothetical protein
MATFNTSIIYTLTNAYTGTRKFLAVDASGSSLQMVDAGSNSLPPVSAEWFLTRANSPPYYHLHALSLGQSKAIDVINDNGPSSINLQMAATGLYSGQNWRFDPWTAGTGGGYRLSNLFTGLNMHLDVYSDSLLPHLASGDYSGQHWTLTPAPVAMGLQARVEAAASSTTSKTGTATPLTPLSGNGGSRVGAAFILGITGIQITACILVLSIVAYIAFKVGRKSKAPAVNWSFGIEAEEKAGLTI